MRGQSITFASATKTTSHLSAAHLLKAMPETVADNVAYALHPPPPPPPAASLPRPGVEKKTFLCACHNLCGNLFALFWFVAAVVSQHDEGEGEG